ncbi:hypothetical protein [Modestobacter sp. Leaf380]|uniref:hypothetical protein n=1 Tax=Modestobacter sp. Leaf380 TaxID=1736356 RepID=UPI0006F78818|nr:hypothetical protein [Modestobacter sp. Leaf380]KQS68796.1 hypothetical protein ASG41_07775 [Modestobacter sp. Leaf380]
MDPDLAAASPTGDATRSSVSPERRSGTAPAGAVVGLRQLLHSAWSSPLRRPTRVAAVVLGVTAVVLETSGLVGRLACLRGDCGPTATAWARVLDMDHVGSVPRLLVTSVFAVVCLVALTGAVRCHRAGARPWWLALAVGAAALSLAKAWSWHSLVEVGLSGLLPAADVQLVFVATAVVGIAVVTASGRRVRRDTRIAVTTWLALYAVAAVGLSALASAVAGAGPTALALGTWVEETAEALAAVGLLAVVVHGVVDLSRRR